MPSYVTPKKGVEYIFYIGLTQQADTKLLQVNPTIAAGDFKVSIDGGAFANPSTLPAVTPAGGRAVKCVLSTSEMNGDNIIFVASDAAGAEWCDQIVNIQTSARQIDDLAFPTVSGRSLDVTATGGAGVDWSNVENPTTSLALTGTTISTSQVAASVTGAVGSVTGNVGGNVNGNVNGNLGGTLTSATRNAIADSLLLRDQTLVASPAVNLRCPLNAIRLLNCKWTVLANTLSVYAEDGTTLAWSATETVSSTASPITGSAPA